MSCLSKNLKPSKVAREKYQIGDDHVWIAPLSSKAWVALSDRADKEVCFHVLAACLQDDNGQALFESADDCKANCELPVSAMLKLVEAVLAFSGLSPDEPKKN